MSGNIHMHDILAKSKQNIQKNIKNKKLEVLNLQKEIEKLQFS
jgi:hypothetical protein